MEGIVQAWGKILTGYRPNLSIEITRECPLRCPGCYAYGDDHLGGGRHPARTRRPQGPGADRRPARGRRSLQPAARVARRRRAAGPLPRTRHRAAAAVGARALRASGHERGAPDPAGLGVDSAPADLRVDRRPAAGARRAPHAGDLRSHSQAHRGPPDHGALHRHSPAGDARGLHRRRSCAPGPRTRTCGRSGSASTRRRSANSRRRC